MLKLTIVLASMTFLSYTALEAIPVQMNRKNSFEIAKRDSKDNTEEIKKRLRESLLSQAEVDFNDNPNKTIIINYINEILDDGILDDPKTYLYIWAEERGMTREYRMPEDPARSWFNWYLLPQTDS